MSERSVATGTTGASGATAERPAIFVLCDGVLSERGELLAQRLDDRALLSVAVDGLRLLSRQGVPVLALIRRRSAPGEAGLRRAERAYADRIGAELRRRGAHIQAILFVPDPERDRERAQATMARALRLAARRRGIDLGASMLICDTWADIEAGLAVGCQPLLVMTSSGRAEINRPQTAGVRTQTWYAADLMMAALSVGAHFGSGDTLAGFSAATDPGGRQPQPAA